MMIKTLYQTFQLADSQLADTLTDHSLVKNVILNIYFSFFQYF